MPYLRERLAKHTNKPIQFFSTLHKLQQRNSMCVWSLWSGYVCHPWPSGSGAAFSGLVYLFGSSGYVYFSLLCICKRALKGGGGNRAKGKMSQCIVTSVPMVWLMVS